MRSLTISAIVALALVGCESKKSDENKGAAATPAKPTSSASLVDITSATSLAAVRSAFNAHKGEARFLTLLSPT